MGLVHYRAEGQGRYEGALTPYEQDQRLSDGDPKREVAQLRFQQTVNCSSWPLDNFGGQV